VDQAAELAGRAGEMAGRARERVGSAVDSTTDYLRAADGARVRGDLESFIRGNPARVLLTTFAVGFLIGRLLR